MMMIDDDDDEAFGYASNSNYITALWTRSQMYNNLETARLTLKSSLQLGWSI